LGLTGTKRGCEVLACGACTVLMNDRPVSSCGVLAADLHGAEVWTIEGLHQSGDARFAALQQGFVNEVGFQCGYCTSGQLCLAKALFTHDSDSTERVPTRDWMANNLCRCGSYLGILSAVENARADVSADGLGQ
jgi:xanthine dehydrogenase YagT iron-sulfur-binding subunit